MFLKNYLKDFFYLAKLINAEKFAKMYIEYMFSIIMGEWKLSMLLQCVGQLLG